MARVAALVSSLVLGTAMAGPAEAALTQAQLDAVAASPAAGAAVPDRLVFVDAAGRPLELRALFGRRPIVLVLADYRCREICGPILAIAAHALASSGLAAGRDFDLVVVGIDPRASGADAARMRHAELDDVGDLGAATHVLVGSAPAVAALETALGYRAAYDEVSARYAHPADIFVLTATGIVSRVLPALDADGPGLRLALVEAGQGRIGTLRDRFHLLCYGLDPARGAANAAVRMALAGGGLLTLLGMAGLVAAMERRRAGLRP